MVKEPGVTEKADKALYIEAPYEAGTPRYIKVFAQLSFKKAGTIYSNENISQEIFVWRQRVVHSMHIAGTTYSNENISQEIFVWRQRVVRSMHIAAKIIRKASPIF